MSVDSFSIHCRAVTDEGPSKLQVGQTLPCCSVWLTSGITNPQVQVRSVIHLPSLCHLGAVCFRNIKIAAIAGVTPRLWVQLQPLSLTVCATLDIRLILPYIILIFSFVSLDCIVSRAEEPVAYHSMRVSGYYCYAKLIMK